MKNFMESRIEKHAPNQIIKNIASTFFFPLWQEAKANSQDYKSIMESNVEEMHAHCSKMCITWQGFNNGKEYKREKVLENPRFSM